ncbi:MAG: MinD/ParA family protein [Alphaproteobacteria bacterium]|nr:MinD/ParA family protein [Alphaproteobacteria bacterium]
MSEALLDSDLVENTAVERTPSRARRIAVASGKGGVGKTWFASTLAHNWALKGRRTLLFDGDLGLANVDVQLGLAPETDLSEVIAGRARIEDAVLRGAAENLDVIAGSSGTASLAALPASRLDRLIADLDVFNAGYDRIVLDLGAGVDNTVRMLAATADTVLVVTTAEPTAMTDAYAFIKLMLLRDPDTDLRVVVNQAASVKEGEAVYETLRKACDKFLKYTPPLAGIVRIDRRVTDAIRSQSLIMTRHPTAAAAEDVEKIARGLRRAFE